MKRLFLILTTAALLLALAGCAGAGGTGSFERRLALTGAAEPYMFIANLYEQPIQIAEYIQPQTEEFDLLIIGSDGFSAMIPGDDLSGCTLVYSKEFEWEFRAEQHPPSANVKNVMGIMVVGPEDDLPTSAMKEEGTSQLNGRSVTVYTPNWPMPESNITRVYHEAVGFLEQGERVMVIELDGTGFEMLQRSEANYLKSLEPEQVLACFPPNSQVSLAAMLTGKLPSENGIAVKGARDLVCEDIFVLAEKMGKTCALIEGNSTVINASKKPVLSLNDADVFANAQKAMEEEPDLLFIHFHEIDDQSHANGPYAAETQEKLIEIDGYVQALAEGFDGRVIITADHGQHKTPEGGNHGLFLPEDMVVPYIVL